MDFRILVLFGCICFVLTGCQPSKESNTVKDDAAWAIYRGSPRSTSYSPLEQINKNNIKQLQLAWVFKPKDSPNSQHRSQTNPIVVNGVMYTISGRGVVYALDPTNGKKIWSFDPYNGKSVRISKVRAVTYWRGGGGQYILFSAGHYLYEVDALTGKSIQEFGQNGRVDLRKGLRDAPEDIYGIVRATSPGIIYNNLIILGYRGTDKYGDTPGDTRAYNVKTGELVWSFHGIPRPGDPGYDTWPKNAWKYVGGGNDWSGMSVDKKRGMVFLALGSASIDFYGGGRVPGKNLFTNCVVALNASNGKLIWHFQTVHHDLWDYDIPAPPVLVTVERNGKKIDAVAAANKNGFLFVLNRETGKSLFPIKEKKVPASTVPGEKAWPTQPFPQKPKPFSNQHMADSLIANLSPEVHDSLLNLFHSLRYEGLFTPPSIQGTFVMPATIGGVEWGSLAYDTQTHLIYVQSTNNSAEIAKLRDYTSGKESTTKKKSGSKSLASMTVYQRGNLFYKQHCASCHGPNRQGGIGPSLVGLKNSITRAQVLKQINLGSATMPGFARVLSTNQKNAIIAYLFDKKHAKETQANTSKLKKRFDEIRKLLVDRGRDPDLPMYKNITGHRPWRDKEGKPPIKSPWNLLSAINLNTGDYEWQIAIGGRTPGPMVTGGGLVIIATSGRGGQADGQFQHKLKAYDKGSGKLLWETSLPAAASSTPSTYRINGKQYIVFSVAGTKANPGGSVVAFALAEKK